MPSPRAPRSGARRSAEPGGAWFGGWHARRLVEASDDVSCLDGGGWWAVLVTFEGLCRFWRFEQVEAAALPRPPKDRAWHGPEPGSWRSSLDRGAYLAGVEEIRRRIHEGEVYQVNLCRVLSAPLPDQQVEPGGRPGGGPQGGPHGGPWELAERLAAGNPAPYAGVIDVPAIGGLPATQLVCASPELFLERRAGWISSGPIKGTAVTEAQLQPKDVAENVMIVDLVRNDLQRVAQAGTVAVPSLLRLEQHPGLVHLVSTVEGRLVDGVTWRDLLAATMPPGSVSGAPKSSALRAIRDLEPAPRGPYCGAVGYVDADAGLARLAVAIRTFWWQDGTLCFGTGAGITWGSAPAAEWDETELKAARLIGLASAEDQDQDQVSRRATAASRSR